MYIIPARFLVLIAHLMLTILVLWDRKENILACLPVSYSQSQYHNLDVQIIVATSITFALFLLELLACLFALSVTVDWQNLFSLLCHAAGDITLAYYIMDTWCCSLYWYVFGFCCIPPAVTEVFVWLTVWVVKKQT